MFSLPNLITALNLFLGCMACIELVEGHYEPALILLAGCLLADFLDGFVARMMASDSLLGVQLDSLADVVSFGLAPGLMIFKLMESNGTGMYADAILPYFGLILPVFAAFRLARFNIETTGVPTHFTGLPVPAMALFFMGYLGGRNFLPEWMLEDFFLIACSIIFSLLDDQQTSYHKGDPRKKLDVQILSDGHRLFDLHPLLFCDRHALSVFVDHFSCYY
jgi:CDP-diacylglycerol--serine O-phosphatidyltransferase